MTIHHRCKLHQRNFMLILLQSSRPEIRRGPRASGRVDAEPFSKPYHSSPWKGFLTPSLPFPMALARSVEKSPIGVIPFLATFFEFFSHPKNH